MLLGIIVIIEGVGGTQMRSVTHQVNILIQWHRDLDDAPALWLESSPPPDKAVKRERYRQRVSSSGKRK